MEFIEEFGEKLPKDIMNYIYDSFLNEEIMKCKIAKLTEEYADILNIYHCFTYNDTSDTYDDYNHIVFVHDAYANTFNEEYAIYYQNKYDKAYPTSLDEFFDVVEFIDDEDLCSCGNIRSKKCLVGVIGDKEYFINMTYTWYNSRARGGSYCSCS
jgi:hypothetical protein